MIFDENGNEIKKTKVNNIINTPIIKDYVVFDFETTSKYPDRAKIIEIAAVKVRNDKIVNEFETFINPQISIPKDATNINGITNEMVKNAPILDDKIGAFYKFIENEVLIGHKINGFDLNILSRECSKLLNIDLNNDFLDTCQLSCHVEIKEKLENRRLETLCRHFKIKEIPNHRALQDVKANLELYKILKNLLPKENSKSKKSNTQSSKTNKSRNSELNFKCTFDVNDKNICLTGKFKCAIRDDIKKYLKQLGAKINDDICSKTEYLIIGDYGTKTKHKYADAEELGIKILYEKDFITTEEE